MGKGEGGCISTAAVVKVDLTVYIASHPKVRRTVNCRTCKNPWMVCELRTEKCIDDLSVER